MLTSVPASFCQLYHNTSHVKCCVEMVFELKRATSDEVWQSKIKAFSMSIGDVLTTAKWLSILVMTWSLQESPFLPPSPASKDFMNGVWLDILDCFTFVSYIDDPNIQMPSVGLTADGKPSPAGMQYYLERRIWYTWLVSSMCELLSPLIYTWFRYRETEPQDGGKPYVTKDSILQELMERVRVLDKDGAEETLDEAFRMTQADIAEPANENEVTYRVEYDDGSTEDGVELCQLQPTEDQPYADDVESCTGWCRTSYLRPDDAMTAMQRRAKLIDAFRSVLTLELPFFLWRLWFNWGDTSGIQVHLLTVKNGLWGFGDLLTILACGNEDATIMGYERFMTTGPGALTAKVTKYAQKAAKSDLLKLELKLEFLKQEQYFVPDAP
ncbi:unnamed protein product [Symbiodinium microadriaticum]|nr:unnamed protein product [Symbiodinium microadriaticum]